MQPAHHTLNMPLLPSELVFLRKIRWVLNEEQAVSACWANLLQESAATCAVEGSGLTGDSVLHDHNYLLVSGMCCLLDACPNFLHKVCMAWKREELTGRA